MATKSQQRSDYPAGMAIALLIVAIPFVSVGIFSSRQPQRIDIICGVPWSVIGLWLSIRGLLLGERTFLRVLCIAVLVIYSKILFGFTCWAIWGEKSGILWIRPM